MYLAVVEQFPDAVETLESAAGAIQNLTACQWKVREGGLGDAWLATHTDRQTDRQSFTGCWLDVRKIGKVWPEPKCQW